MEVILALAVFLLAGCGLAAGIFFGRGPVKGSCGGMSCLKDHDCEACPNRHTARHEP